MTAMAELAGQDRSPEGGVTEAAGAAKHSPEADATGGVALRCEVEGVVCLGNKGGEHPNW